VDAGLNIYETKKKKEKEKREVIKDLPPWLEPGGSPFKGGR
jgi:hypothetical protein